jgi:hypothetical protein
MEKEKLDIDQFNRLSLGIIEKEGCSPDAAMERLESLCINFSCTDLIANSLPLQASLLTAINTAKRAFLGGVYLQLPAGIACLLPWPGHQTLDQIAIELGAIVTKESNPIYFSIVFGAPASIDDNRVQIVCNNWQAGILSDNETCPFDQAGNIPTAGIFAGGYAVCQAFMKLAGINIAALDKSAGISLWRPDLHWLDAAAGGPFPIFLPRKYWVLGLGHLGQAYCWNIGLLRYNKQEEVTLLLQDDDSIVPGNWSAGLLTEKGVKEIHKTRLCSAWLEERDFRTTITERRFDAATKRTGEEPFIALCGFDTAASRLPLEDAGFDLVAEAGLGKRLQTFDVIALHTFPGAAKSPREIWGNENETGPGINEAVYEVLACMDKEVCGIVPMTIAGKSISASFVGTCSGAMVIAELLRGLHGGKRYDKINIQLRDIDSRVAVVNKKNDYTVELSKNGFSTI